MSSTVNNEPLIRECPNCWKARSILQEALSEAERLNFTFVCTPGDNRDPGVHVPARLGGISLTGCRYCGDQGKVLTESGQAVAQIVQRMLKKAGIDNLDRSITF